MGSTAADAAARTMLEELSALLGDLSDELVVIGGVAVNFWTKPRYTHDVDFNVRSDAGLMATITRRLTGAGYVVTRNEAPVAASGPDFVQFKRVTPQGEHVVEFQAAKTEFQVLTIDRGHRLGHDQPFAVATPEDLIVLKLIANRPQDVGDCVGLASLPNLDWPYIQAWCEVWGVGDRALGLIAARDAEVRRLAQLHADLPPPG